MKIVIFTFLYAVFDPQGCLESIQGVFFMQVAVSDAPKWHQTHPSIRLLVSPGQYTEYIEKMGVEGQGKNI